MSQQTYNDQFNSATASLISKVLISPIIAYYKEHQDEAITEEKIMEILNMPAPVNVLARTPQRGTAMATTQSLTTGSSTKRTRASKVSSDRPQCKWVFTKGANYGKQCPSLAVEDSEYCSTCRNKRGAGGKGRPTSGNSGARSSSRNNNTATKQTGLTSSSKQSPASPPEDDKEVSIDSFGTSTDGCKLFIEPSTNFVLKSENDDDYVVVGIGVYEDGGKRKRVKPLTEKDKDRVKKELDLKCIIGEEITLIEEEEEGDDGSEQED